MTDYPPFIAGKNRPLTWDGCLFCGVAVEERHLNTCAGGTGSPEAHRIWNAAHPTSALFIWRSEAPPPAPPPLTMREVLLLADASTGAFAGLAEDWPIYAEIMAAAKHRDAVEAYREQMRARPFVPEPNIPVAGRRDGLAWGWLDVDDDTRPQRVLMTVPPVPFGALPPSTSFAVFRPHRYRIDGRVVAALLHEALDSHRVLGVLESLFRAAA